MLKLLPFPIFIIIILLLLLGLAATKIVYRKARTGNTPLIEEY